MNLERTLLSIAMESGEVATPEPVMEYEPDPVTETEEYLELMNANADEIGRTVAVTQSLEALAKRYEATDITPESMESYQFALTQVLNASGARIPVAVVAPSFEAAEKDKTTIGAKVKGVVESLLKWIQERYAALKAMFKRFAAKLGFAQKKTEERNTEAKADISKLTTAKITEIGGKDKPAANEPAKPAAKAPEKKPETTPSERLTEANKKAAEAAKTNPPKPFPSGKSEKDEQKKRSTRVPGWAVEGGKLNVTKVRTYITQLNGGNSDLSHLIAGNKASGGNLPAKETGEYMKTDPFNTAFKKFKTEYPDGGYTTDYTASVSDVKSLIDAAFTTTSHLTAEIMGLEQGMASSQNNLTREINREKGPNADHDHIAALRKEAADDLAYWQALISFTTSVRNSGDALHKILCAMVK